jgi:hypothetical protein
MTLLEAVDKLDAAVGDNQLGGQALSEGYARSAMEALREIRLRIEPCAAMPRRMALRPLLAKWLPAWSADRIEGALEEIERLFGVGR